MESQKLIIPYVNSKIHHDIASSILLVPLLWFLGLDQVFWPIVAFYIIIKFLLSENQIEIDKIGKVIFSYFVVYIFSIVFIQESFRYITYLRNLIIFLSSLTFFFSAYYACRSLSRVKIVLLSIVLLECVVSVAAFLPIIGFNVDFLSLFGWLVPLEGKSAYFEVMVNKTFARPEAGLWFSKEFVRPVGMMMYPNCLAGLVGSMITLKLYFIRIAGPIAKIVLFLTLLVDVVVFIAALSRGAWLAAIFGLFVFFVLGKITFKGILNVLVISLCLGTLAFFLNVDSIVSERFGGKAHSNEGRLLIYTLTVEDLINNPVNLFFGNGTQKDHPLIKQPLGSHSGYLGIIYKQGLLGFFLYALMHLLILKRAVFELNQSKSNAELFLLRKCILYAYGFFLFHAIFDEPDTDAVYSIVFWTICGLTILPLTVQERFKFNKGAD